METFARLIRATEARQNIHLRGESYGEYDLIVSPLRYKILEKYLPAALRLYKKILRRQKKEV